MGSEARNAPEVARAEPTRYYIRPMRDEDIPQVLDIDHEAFVSQWPPVSYSSLKQELHNRMARYMTLCTREPRPFPGISPAPTPETARTGGDGSSAGVWRRFRSFFQRLQRLGASAPAVAPSATETIIGFAGAWKMYDEVHIIAIAVKNCFRRLGCGERLLIEIIEDSMTLGARVVTLEVRLSNRAAQSLYVKYGFRTAGVRHAYYSDNNEDALIMTTDHITADSFKIFFRQLKANHAAQRQDLYTPA